MGAADVARTLAHLSNVRLSTLNLGEGSGEGRRGGRSEGIHCSQGAPPNGVKPLARSGWLAGLSSLAGRNIKLDPHLSDSDRCGSELNI